MLDFKVRFLMIVEDIINFFKPTQQAYVDSLIGTEPDLERYTDLEIEQFLSKHRGKKNT